MVSGYRMPVEVDRRQTLSVVLASRLLRTGLKVSMEFKSRHREAC